MEEIALITMTAKVSNMSFTAVPVHFKHDFSGVPKVQTGFHLSKRSPHSLKKSVQENWTNLEIQIFEVWYPPCVGSSRTRDSCTLRRCGRILSTVGCNSVVGYLFLDSSSYLRSWSTLSCCSRILSNVVSDSIVDWLFLESSS